MGGRLPSDYLAREQVEVGSQVEPLFPRGGVGDVAVPQLFLLAEFLALLLELQNLIILVCDGIAASGERFLAIGPMLR